MRADDIEQMATRLLLHIPYKREHRHVRGLCTGALFALREAMRLGVSLTEFDNWEKDFVQERELEDIILAIGAGEVVSSRYWLFGYYKNDAAVRIASAYEGVLMFFATQEEVNGAKETWESERNIDEKKRYPKIRIRNIGGKARGERLELKWRITNAGIKFNDDVLDLLYQEYRSPFMHRGGFIVSAFRFEFSDLMEAFSDLLAVFEQAAKRGYPKFTGLTGW